MTESLEREIRDLRSLFWSDRDPEGRAFAPLADAYRRAGDFRQALELLKDGLDRHPTFSSGHVVSARVHYEGGLVHEAALAARKALELDEENVEALRTLVDALEASGEVKEAEEARAQLWLLDPGAEEPSEAGDIGALAPDEPWNVPADQLDDEPVAEMEDLAPDHEPAAEVADLAPDEESVTEVADLAPDEEPVVDIADLAPDEEPVVDIVDLAPDEEPVVEMADLASDEEPVVDIADLAPDETIEPAEELPAAFAPDAEASEDEDEPEHEPLYTRTMAALFVQQGLTERALDVYRRLLVDHPGDADLVARVADLEGSRVEGGSGDAGGQQPDVEAVGAAATAWEVPADEEGGEGEEEETEIQARQLADAGEGLHDVDTPFTWTEAEGPEAESGGPEIGAYFRRMLAWTRSERPSGEGPE